MPAMVKDSKLILYRPDGEIIKTINGEDMYEAAKEVGANEVVLAKFICEDPQCPTKEHTGFIFHDGEPYMAEWLDRANRTHRAMEALMSDGG